MTPTPKVARRRIAVVEHVPTQLVLGLAWPDPIDRVIRAEPEPGPVAPVALPVIGRRAAA